MRRALVAGVAALGLFAAGGVSGAAVRDRLVTAPTPSWSQQASGSDTQMSPDAVPDTQGGARQLPGGEGTGSPAALQQGVRVDKPGVLLVQVAGQGFEGAGTGMILSADGLAVTNYHVVSGSGQVQVEDVSSGKTYTADVLGHDQSRDVAVLRLRDASGLTTVTTDRAASVSSGAGVTAVGNGSGQGYLTALTGTVTATGQEITAQSDGAAASEKLTGLIETNAPVVPGYSGGPLYGGGDHVVGMLAAASAGNGKGDADSYAIPIGTVLDVVDTVKAGTSTGSVVVGRNPALGVSIAGSSQSGSGGTRGFGRGGSGTAQAAGVQIAGVQAGGAAAGAGLVAGDVITGVDGTRITSADQLQSTVRAHKPGQSVTLEWTSVDGRSHRANVTLGTSTVN